MQVNKMLTNRLRHWSGIKLPRVIELCLGGIKVLGLILKLCS